VRPVHGGRDSEGYWISPDRLVDFPTVCLTSVSRAQTQYERGRGVDHSLLGGLRVVICRMYIGGCTFGIGIDIGGSERGSRYRIGVVVVTRLPFLQVEFRLLRICRSIALSHRVVSQTDRYVDQRKDLKYCVGIRSTSMVL